MKSYFVLGGAMHDAAVSAWGIKGWYDYVRPVSALRWMCDRGQSQDPEKRKYNERGIPLIEGFIELVEPGDPLAGEFGENVNLIKMRAWRGPDYIAQPETDVAGVGWILAQKWWPYQRPTFVTPPFAGYVSGHSTFSRAAAEVMTLLTGDEFFPGGMGEFHAPAHEFLVFEDGPSVDVTLQWATYRDASDQTGLSRIWGGIHPPADDIPGRLIGVEVGVNAFEFAVRYFGSPNTAVREHRADQEVPGEFSLDYNYPNPFNSRTVVRFHRPMDGEVELTVYGVNGQRVATLETGVRAAGSYRLHWDGRDDAGRALATGPYFVRLRGNGQEVVRKLTLLR
ncbi:MAG: FlgD immunoglobulin-like domain containing protein [Candidatus Latescibacterota bacterium]|nr:FlgD immunoglobulin-like domain containing protein [Candidatus Latescibacterota bacterium]